MVAAKTCAEDVKGQTCCGKLHAGPPLKTKEGLVRDLGDRALALGTEGFAHLSCLAEQAKILIEDAEERIWAPKAFGERWARWLKCSLCEHGIPRHRAARAQSGRAGRRVGRPEVDLSRRLAMGVGWNGLSQRKAMRGRDDAAAELTGEQEAARGPRAQRRALCQKSFGTAGAGRGRSGKRSKSPPSFQSSRRPSQSTQNSPSTHFPDPIRQVPGCDDMYSIPQKRICWP